MYSSNSSLDTLIACNPPFKTRSNCSLPFALKGACRAASSWDSFAPSLSRAPLVLQKLRPELRLAGSQIRSEFDVSHHRHRRSLSLCQTKQHHAGWLEEVGFILPSIALLQLPGEIEGQERERFGCALATVLIEFPQRCLETRGKELEVVVVWRDEG